MPAIDFKEIPPGNNNGEEQDTFELFARDFLELLGCEIVEAPGRGADGGRDLIVLETRQGILGITKFRWLVSCKHKAHSGQSVTPRDENDLIERVKSKNCQGFLGFYSTIPSEALKLRLDSLTQTIDSTSKIDEVFLFDREAIEAPLLNSPVGVALARRYFPKSIEKRKRQTEILKSEAFIEQPEDKEKPFPLWDLVSIENGVDLYWLFNPGEKTTELHFKSELHDECLAQLQISDEDCESLSMLAVTTGSWSYVEFDRKDCPNILGLITLGYSENDGKKYIQRQVNYAKCQYLMSQLRKCLGDWDDNFLP